MLVYQSVHFVFFAGEEYFYLKKKRKKKHSDPHYVPLISTPLTQALQTMQ